MIIFHRKNISVITDRVHTFLQCFRKYIEIRLIVVEILLQTWMNDHFGDRIPVIDLQDIRKLFGKLHSDPRLHRDLAASLLRQSGYPLKYRIKEPI